MAVGFCWWWWLVSWGFVWGFLGGWGVWVFFSGGGGLFTILNKCALGVGYRGT